MDNKAKADAVLDAMQPMPMKELVRLACPICDITYGDSYAAWTGGRFQVFTTYEDVPTVNNQPGHTLKRCTMCRTWRLYRRDRRPKVTADQWNLYSFDRKDWMTWSDIQEAYGASERR